MKFSYSLIKQLVPGLPVKAKVAEELYLKSFETEDGGGDILNIEIPHNRYSDAASHWGVAKEAAAIFNLKARPPKGLTDNKFRAENRGLLKISIHSARLARRYGALYGTLEGRGSTPVWLRQTLATCGLQSINPVVDIMNYVMLETGQPLHAFDADKLEGDLRVRRARKGETILTLDNQRFTLQEQDLVIADAKEPVALAGIKGGKKAEVDRKTKRIIVEAANFDQVVIYQTSRRLNLLTDASARFGHGLAPVLVDRGLNRVQVLLRDLTGFKLLDSVNLGETVWSREIIGFAVEKFNALIGLNLNKRQISGLLRRLGFKILPADRFQGQFDFLVEVPAVRSDITIFEDLVEEVARLYGYNELPPRPPQINLTSATEDDLIRLKDRLRRILVGLGLSEVYTYSFSASGDALSYQLENPIAVDKSYLRVELSSGLKKVIRENAVRLAGEPRPPQWLGLFEIGKVFRRDWPEKTCLGIALWSKKDNAFLKLKGVVTQTLYRAGLVDFLFQPSGRQLLIITDNQVLGQMEWSGEELALAEIDLDSLLRLINEEYQFRPLPRYPSVVRDLSLAMKENVLVGELLEAIYQAPSPYLWEADLLDYYDERHFTFRLVFQAKDRTLRDEEVNREVEKIVKFLGRKFSFRVR